MNSSINMLLFLKKKKKKKTEREEPPPKTPPQLENTFCFLKKKKKKKTESLSKMEAGESVFVGSWYSPWNYWITVESYT